MRQNFLVKVGKNRVEIEVCVHQHLYDGPLYYLEHLIETIHYKQKFLQKIDAKIC